MTKKDKLKAVAKAVAPGIFFGTVFAAGGFILYSKLLDKNHLAYTEFLEEQNNLLRGALDDTVTHIADALHGNK